jgi:hypothetical protein
VPVFPACEMDFHADLGERIRADLAGLLKLGAGIYLSARPAQIEPSSAQAKAAEPRF